MFSLFTKQTKKSNVDKHEPKETSSKGANLKKSLSGEGFDSQEKALIPEENKTTKDNAKKPSLLGQLGALKHEIGKHIPGSEDWRKDMWEKATMAAGMIKLEDACTTHRDAFFAFCESEYSPESLLAYEDIMRNMSVQAFYEKWIKTEIINVGAENDKNKEALANCEQGKFDQVDIGLFKAQLKVAMTDTFGRFRYGPARRYFYKKLTGREAPKDFK